MTAGRRAGRWGLGLVTLLVVTGCPNAGEERVLSIRGTGMVGGVVYLDVDGNRRPGGPDAGLQNVRVRLVVAGTRDTVAEASSDDNGTFVMGDVPVGRYTVVVPGEEIFADTISVVRIDTSYVSLSPDDTLQVEVAVSYPALTVSEARQTAAGTKVFVEGVALNTRGFAPPPYGTFGDTTVHVADTSGAIRVTGARGPLVSVGDSVRVLGRVSVRDGQPTISDGQFTIIEIVGAPAAGSVTTAIAASADGGRLDAALVRVVDATISDTATVEEDYVATVDDGSGPVRVVLDHDIWRTPPVAWIPGAVMSPTGVLVPDGTGSWRLKPRGDDDL